MRLLSILIIATTLFSCSDNENKRLELVPEPDKDLREEYEKQELEKTDSINKEPSLSKSKLH